MTTRIIFWAFVLLGLAIVTAITYANRDRHD